MDPILPQCAQQQCLLRNWLNSRSRLRLGNSISLDHHWFRNGVWSNSGQWLFGVDLLKALGKFSFPFKGTTEARSSPPPPTPHWIWMRRGDVSAPTTGYFTTNVKRVSLRKKPTRSEHYLWFISQSKIYPPLLLHLCFLGQGVEHGFCYVLLKASTWLTEIGPEFSVASLNFFLGLTGMGPWESRAESMVAFNSLLTHCLWVFEAVRKWHQAVECQLVDRESAVWTSFTCTGICSKAFSFTATIENVNLSMNNIFLWCLFLYLPEQMHLRVGYPHGWEGMWYCGAHYSALRVSQRIVTPSLVDYAPLSHSLLLLFRSPGTKPRGFQGTVVYNG